jgi:hypothetical protein
LINRWPLKKINASSHILLDNFQSLLMAGGEPNVPTEPDQLTKQIYLQVAAPIGSKITLNSLSSVSCCQNVAPDVSVPQKGANKKH